MNFEHGIITLNERTVRILIATNHLYRFAGSELLALEMADEFCRKGCDVSLFANFSDPDFISSNADKRIKILQKTEVRLTSYDLVYCQHQVLSAFSDQILEALESTRGKGPFFVFGHLSPYESMEKPGPVIEALAADLILYNSWETQQEFNYYRPSGGRSRIYPNPAPREFFKISELCDTSAEKLLVVSNHLPTELQCAIRLLRGQGKHVRVIGRGFEEVRVTAADIEKCSAVISIGKTIQYAIAARRPAYIYDRFGGPGWLTTDNFESARRLNFSGRCCNRKLKAEALAAEISGGAPNDSQKAAEWSDWRNEFCIETHLTDLLEDVFSFQTARRKGSLSRNILSEADRVRIRLEGESYRNGLRMPIFEKELAFAKRTRMQSRRNRSRPKTFLGRDIRLPVRWVRSKCSDRD